MGPYSFRTHLLPTSIVFFDRARLSRLFLLAGPADQHEHHPFLITTTHLDEIIPNRIFVLNYKDILEMMPTDKLLIINFLLHMPLIEINPTGNRCPRTIPAICLPSRPN
jgi:hypothetical protein